MWDVWGIGVWGVTQTRLLLFDHLAQPDLLLRLQFLLLLRERLLLQPRRLRSFALKEHRLSVERFLRVARRRVAARPLDRFRRVGVGVGVAVA